MIYYRDIFITKYKNAYNIIMKNFFHPNSFSSEKNGFYRVEKIAPYLEKKKEWNTKRDFEQANQSKNAKELDKLSYTPELAVVVSVIRNKNTSPQTLERLYMEVKDQSDKRAEMIKRNLAFMNTTPNIILSKLAKSKNAFMRAMIANNRNTMELDFFMLAKDRDEYVRVKLAENISIPEKVAKILEKDRNPLVRSWINTQGPARQRYQDRQKEGEDQLIFDWGSKTKKKVSHILKERA